MEQDKQPESCTVKFTVAGVAAGLTLGAVIQLAHLPKDDPTLPFTLAPGLKFMVGTTAGSSMPVIGN
jgi:hypothetical protein